MIKNSEALFRRAQEFQDARTGIIDKFEKRMSDIENTKGSAFYAVESKEAAARMNEALGCLQKEYASHFNDILGAMRKTNAGRKMTPPTEEELRTLELLKMKDKPTEAELSAAANTLQANPICLSVLSEISRNAGYTRGYMNYSETKEMPVNEAEAAIKSLSDGINDFLQYDTSKAARRARRFHDEHYGAVPGAEPLRKRKQFSNKAECFQELAGFSAGALESFARAVDCEEGKE